MNVPAWLDKKIQLGPTPSQFSRHNPAIFGEITSITHNALFMQFVILKHHIYIFSMVSIHTIRFTRSHFGMTVITCAVTPPWFVGAALRPLRSTGYLHKWSECRKNKNLGGKNINWHWFPRLAHMLGVLWCVMVSVDLITIGGSWRINSWTTNE